MKYYQVIETSRNNYDENILYTGYDKLIAVMTLDRYLNMNCDSRYTAELRMYNISKPWEDMTDDEICEVISCGYFIID